MSAEKILVFGGTSEGRILCEKLAEAKRPFAVSVAGDYGEECLDHLQGIELYKGRLNRDEMLKLIKSFGLVIDATHPYAREVSLNISEACMALGIKSIRVIRPAYGQSGAGYFGDIPKLCDYLEQREGSALISTGSKDLQLYTGLTNYRERLFVRVLPSVESISHCTELGFAPSHIIAMQGPFSTELNIAMLKQCGASFLITKESGGSGGFEEKLKAAKLAGVKLLVLGRPCKEEGLSLEELTEHLGIDGGEEDCPFPMFINLKNRPVTVVGGGNIALRRVKTLLSCNAKIRLIAPRIKPELEALAKSIVIEQREFMPRDIEGAFFVLAATDNTGVNCEVEALCRKSGILVNRCDSRDHCDFYFPALIKSEELVAGLCSKTGQHHKLVREKARDIRTTLGGLV